MSRSPVNPYQRGRRQQAISRNLDLLPPASILVRNLIAVYDMSTRNERRAGIAWYSLAHVEAERVCLGHPQSAAIVAAMSPQASWNQNLENVVSLLDGRPEDTTQSEANIRKAVAIIGGADPNRILGGQKVRAFWRNIENPLSPGPVTVDRHALAAAVLGKRAPEYIRQAVVGKTLERIGTYLYIAGAYRSTARILGLRPHELQAIVWLTWRRVNNITWANHDPF